jgi:hypothetical protein
MAWNQGQERERLHDGYKRQSVLVLKVFLLAFQAEMPKQYSSLLS